MALSKEQKEGLKKLRAFYQEQIANAPEDEDDANEYMDELYHIDYDDFWNFVTDFSEFGTGSYLGEKMIEFGLNPDSLKILKEVEEIVRLY